MTATRSTLGPRLGCVTSTGRNGRLIAEKPHARSNMSTGAPKPALCFRTLSTRSPWYACPMSGAVRAQFSGSSFVLESSELLGKSPKVAITALAVLGCRVGILATTQLATACRDSYRGPKPPVPIFWFHQWCAMTCDYPVKRRDMKLWGNNVTRAFAWFDFRDKIRLKRRYHWWHRDGRSVESVRKHRASVLASVRLVASYGSLTGYK